MIFSSYVCMCAFLHGNRMGVLVGWSVCLFVELFACGSLEFCLNAFIYSKC